MRRAEVFHWKTLEYNILGRSGRRIINAIEPEDQLFGASSKSTPLIKRPGSQRMSASQGGYIQDGRYFRRPNDAIRRKNYPCLITSSFQGSFPVFVLPFPSASLIATLPVLTMLITRRIARLTGLYFPSPSQGANAINGSPNPNLCRKSLERITHEQMSTR
jgi:hypothetical protein